MNVKKEGAPETESTPVSLETQRKSTHYNQFCKTQNAFFSMPKTMMMVAKEIGIDRADVCRYVDTMRKENVIRLIRKSTCPITHCDGVGFYSSDPKFAEKLPVQLSIF